MKIWRFSTALVLMLLAPVAWGQPGITYSNIAAEGGAGITYERMPSDRLAEVLAINARGVIPQPEFFTMVRPESPSKPWGDSGVAVLDYDGDGDLDIYAPNGPGAANSLYSNQYMETGEVTFVDMAIASGADLTDQESAGVCFGDIDNDGDHDIYVLGTEEDNRLLENQGDGTFRDISVSSGTGGGARNPTGCSFADFNADGLLDVVVANSYDDWTHRIPVFGGDCNCNEHSQLFMNNGGNVFSDTSAAAGLESVSNMTGENLNGAAFSWAMTTADYDQDGDVDILFADNQGSQSVSAGLLRLYENDGAANFTEVTAERGLAVVGAWMGLDFGDLNCDGYLDFFATDLGYQSTPSRWFYGSEDGTFNSPGVGELLNAPFGWGTSIYDYDNDGDADVIFHGGVDILSIIVTENLGVLLENRGNCSGDFRYVGSAFSTDHAVRNVQGVAVGDLNHDGFEDIVSISNFDIGTRGQVLRPGIDLGFIFGTGSIFDLVTTWEQRWVPAFDPDTGLTDRIYVQSTREIVGGSLAVEISSADNGYGWAEIHARGSVGTIPGGAVNRDGIGAVVRFTPAGGKTSIRPVTGGGGHNSQDALSANFGLGMADYGSVEVLWPGGVTNRLDNVNRGESLVFPEIPCDYATRSDDMAGYQACVDSALADLVNAGVLDDASAERFRLGAVSCQPGEHTLCLAHERFAVQVEWADGVGGSGYGKVSTSETNSGAFYFFGSETIEIHANVLNGCGINGNYWVFAAASTNVEYTITVTDTHTGEVVEYGNELNQPSQPVLDTEAFATCP